MLKFIPISEFGKDHWSTFAYIECVCVDHKGIPDSRKMRSNGSTHPCLNVNGFAWQTSYGTQLRGFCFEKSGESKFCLPQHDDWDCANDLEAAGLIEIKGTGMNPYFKMTPKGFEVAASLRKHKADGKNFADFVAFDPKELATATH